MERIARKQREFPPQKRGHKGAKGVVGWDIGKRLIKSSNGSAWQSPFSRRMLNETQTAEGIQLEK